MQAEPVGKIFRFSLENYSSYELKFFNFFAQIERVCKKLEFFYETFKYLHVIANVFANFVCRT